MAALIKVFLYLVIRGGANIITLSQFYKRNWLYVLSGSSDPPAEPGAVAGSSEAPGEAVRQGESIMATKSGSKQSFVALFTERSLNRQ